MTERKVTTGGLARATAVSFPTVQKIVSGAMPRRQSTIEAFAKFLGVETQEVIQLIAESGPQRSHPLDQAMDDRPEEVQADEGGSTTKAAAAPMDIEQAPSQHGGQQSLF